MTTEVEASEVDWAIEIEDVVREPTGTSIFFPNYVLPKETGYLTKLYYNFVANCVYYLRSWGWRGLANIVAALMLELMNSLYTGYWSYWGDEKSFHYYELNPTELTEDQKKQPATLLLHGKGSNQAVWVELAKTFEKNSLGPVFTLNTSDGELTDDDLILLEEKYAEIHALYGEEEVKINLIGHSRGAEFSLYAALPPETFSLEEGTCIANGEWKAFRPEIGRIIRLGSPLLDSERDKLPKELQASIYEIDGLRDLIIPDRSTSENHFEVDCGHVSLLYHPEVHDQIIQWLN